MDPADRALFGFHLLQTIAKVARSGGLSHPPEQSPMKRDPLTVLMRPAPRITPDKGARHG